MGSQCDQRGVEAKHNAFQCYNPNFNAAKLGD